MHEKEVRRDWGAWLRASERRSSGRDGGRWLREGNESVTATLFQPPNQSQHINEEAVTDGYNMNSAKGVLHLQGLLSLIKRLGFQVITIRYWQGMWIRPSSNHECS